MFPGTMTQIYTLQVQELLVDSTPCNGDVISPSPYISDSLTADVCEINSTVFPNLGSMTHSKVSGWLCGKCRNKTVRRRRLESIPVSYETRPEVNLGSLIAPLLEMLKQAVIDATASHIFISANILPGHILFTY